MADEWISNRLTSRDTIVNVNLLAYSIQVPCHEATKLLLEFVSTHPNYPVDRVSFDGTEVKYGKEGKMIFCVKSNNEVDVAAELTKIREELTGMESFLSNQFGRIQLKGMELGPRSKFRATEKVVVAPAAAAATNPTAPPPPARPKQTFLRPNQDTKKQPKKKQKKGAVDDGRVTLRDFF